MRLLIIYNPAARNGRAHKLRPAVETACNTLRLDATFWPTQHQGHAAAWLATANLAEYDAVVSAGGDGTLSEVANGMMARAPHDRLPIGILPIGTGNAFARELGLSPGDWHDGLHLIRQGHRKQVDVGYSTTEDGAPSYFINIVNLCFAAEAARASARYKRLGTSAYLLGVFQTMAGLRTYPVTLTVDGHVYPHDAVLLAIANTRYTGTDFLIAPDARYDDGLLDVIVLNPVSRTRLLRLFPTIFTGRHVEAPEVHTYRAHTISVNGPQRLLLSPDGEIGHVTPATFTCLGGALEVFSPA
ncbi:MAG: diacylglycerol kinase family protein [Bacteroidota bacterium]